MGEIDFKKQLNIHIKHKRKVNPSRISLTQPEKLGQTRSTKPRVAEHRDNFLKEDYWKF